MYCRSLEMTNKPACIPCTPRWRSPTWTHENGWRVSVRSSNYKCLSGTFANLHRRVIGKRMYRCMLWWAIVISTVDKTSFQNSVSLKLHQLSIIIIHSPQTPWHGIQKYLACLKHRVCMECPLANKTFMSLKWYLFHSIVVPGSFFSISWLNCLKSSWSPSPVHDF